MAAVQSYNTTAVFQHLSAVDGVYCTRVCGTLRVDAGKNLVSVHVEGIVVAVIEERLIQRPSVSFVYAVQPGVWIRGTIRPLEEFLEVVVLDV